ncbi:type II secretion system protein GspC [Aestuariibacter salexigens]|uniref:type II secretion system protein GspC n=1 Tax=Aestuariibacter salexigens TaxID=226010 RepID=UPI00040B6B51|nr:type II secretion system protein GspC [Aestuariibacter salexigens]
MTVGNFNIEQVGFFLSRHQKQINMLIVALLCLYLIAFAAEMTWKVIPAPDIAEQSTVSTSVPQSNRSDNASLNITKLQRLNLFGDVVEAPQQQQQVSEAPETRLNLTLTGVVSSSQADMGAAIIENNNRQNTYGVGDKIDGTNATLQEVYVDRVIIKNGINRETLMLDGLDYDKRATASARPVPVRPVPEPEPDEPVRRLSDEAVELTQELRNQPGSFTDFIAISPFRQDGQLEGYRVSPGKNPALFESAGLSAGDIITEINGLDLTDIEQSMEAMAALREAQSLQLTVRRGDELMTLYLDIPTPDQTF